MQTLPVPKKKKKSFDYVDTREGWNCQGDLPKHLDEVVEFAQLSLNVRNYTFTMSDYCTCIKEAG